MEAKSLEQFLLTVSDLSRRLAIFNDWLERHGSHSNLVTVEDLAKTEKTIMSQLTDWAATEEADLTAIQTALTSIVTAIAALNAQIATLQANAGTLSAADAASLAQIKTDSDTLLANAQAVLNPATPPTP